MPSNKLMRRSGDMPGAYILAKLQELLDDASRVAPIYIGTGGVAIKDIHRNKLGDIALVLDNGQLFTVIVAES